jgi:excisionase family DNA binding protein
MTNTETVQADTPPLLHIGVVASQLGLSVYMVKRLVDAGRLTSEQIGERTYIPAASVRGYIDSLGREPAVSQ